MSQKTPPTWVNISDWMFSWDKRTQQRVVNQVKDVPGLCAVRYPGLELFWSQGRPIPDRPLRAFMLNDFRSIGTDGSFDVLARRGVDGARGKH